MPENNQQTNVNNTRPATGNKPQHAQIQNSNQSNHKRYNPNRNRGYYNRNRNNQNHDVQEANHDNQDVNKEFVKDGAGNNIPRKRNNFTKEHKHNVKVEETVEDIKRDINRINKEIELEIKEIVALKMGIG